MTRDEVLQTIRREVHHKYVLADPRRDVLWDGAWTQSRYTVKETDDERNQRLADAILALDASC